MRGVGVDIIRMSRVKGWVDDEDMLDLVFTAGERGDASIKKYPHRHLARIYAVKEALMKAAGTGWPDGVHWKDIEVKEDGGGLSIKLFNGARRKYQDNRIFASGGQDGDFAAAMVVIE